MDSNPDLIADATSEPALQRPPATVSAAAAIAAVSI
jgi:hypothetical protein